MYKKDNSVLKSMIIQRNSAIFKRALKHWLLLNTIFFPNLKLSEPFKQKGIFFTAHITLQNAPFKIFQNVLYASKSVHAKNSQHTFGDSIF